MAYEGKPASEFVDMDIVQQHLEKATLEVGRSVIERFRTNTEGALRYYTDLRFDSPLEVLFWTWWEAIGYMNPDLDRMLSLQSQAEVTIQGRLYRVDFVVQPIPQDLVLFQGWQSIAVEVDGHGFHERTREQVMYRDQRDRALQSAGWRVFHFSFGEFTADPLNSVSEVALFAKRQHDSTSRFRFKEGR